MAATQYNFKIDEELKNEIEIAMQATGAESKADFIHKMAIAQKEANESDYWIELLFQSKYLSENSFKSIQNDILEINKLIASIIISTKRGKNEKR